MIVGPACVLTHATAGLSFIALTFSNSDLIRSFGEAGLIATLIALVSVLTAHSAAWHVPAPARGGLRRANQGRGSRRRGAAPLLRLDRRADGAAGRALQPHRPHRRRRRSAAIYANLQPRYHLADQVPDKQQAVQASRELDAKLTGAQPIDVLIEFPKGQSLYSPQTLATIAEVHAIVEKQPGVGNVWSLETLRRWLAQKIGKSERCDAEAICRLSAEISRRGGSSTRSRTPSSSKAAVPDVDSSQLLPIVDSLDKSLAAVRAEHPGYEIAVTGLAVIAARNSASMIEKLNRGLTIEIVFVAAFIGLAFRSFSVMLACDHAGRLPGLLRRRGAVAARVRACNLRASWR